MSEDLAVAPMPAVAGGEFVQGGAGAVPAAASRPVQARDDATLLALWLDGRPAATVEVYSRDTASLFVATGKAIRELTLGDLQAWAATLAEHKPATQARKIAAVKSLCGFAHRLGYLAFDVARPLRLPKLRQARAERIITEAEVARLIGMEPSPRNHALLRLMYACGLRVSEVCALRWRDMRGTRTGGQATVFGKGGKTRAVLLQPKLWKAVGLLRGAAGPDDPVLRSEAGGALDRSQAHRIVKAACARAGISEKASSHWLRHAHASHALDHGAPLHVLKESLGHASLATTSVYTHARPDDGSAKYLPE